jgi:hypothetical protein
MWTTLRTCGTYRESDAEALAASTRSAAYRSDAGHRRSACSTCSRMVGLPSGVGLPGASFGGRYCGQPPMTDLQQFAANTPETTDLAAKNGNGRMPKDQYLQGFPAMIAFMAFRRSSVRSRSAPLFEDV